MRDPRKINIAEVPGCPSAVKLTVNGREVACSSARTAGRSGGVYWFNTNQGEMMREEADVLLCDFFKGDGVCRYRGASEECMNSESAYFGWMCAVCGLFTWRKKAEPQKDTNAAQAANTEETK